MKKELKEITYKVKVTQTEHEAIEQAMKEAGYTVRNKYIIQALFHKVPKIELSIPDFDPTPILEKTPEKTLAAPATSYADKNDYDLELKLQDEERSALEKIKISLREVPSIVTNFGHETNQSMLRIQDAIFEELGSIRTAAERFEDAIRKNVAYEQEIMKLKSEIFQLKSSQAFEDVINDSKKSTE